MHKNTESMLKNKQLIKSNKIEVNRIQNKRTILKNRNKVNFKNKYLTLLKECSTKRTSRYEKNSKILNNALRRTYSNCKVAERLSSNRDESTLMMGYNEMPWLKSSLIIPTNLNCLDFVDYYAKIFYPIAFVLFNLVYFCFYLFQRT